MKMVKLRIAAMGPLTDEEYAVVEGAVATFEKVLSGFMLSPDVECGAKECGDSPSA